MMKKYAFLLSLFLLFSNSLMALSECVIKSEEINSVLTSENKNVVDYTKMETVTVTKDDVLMYSGCGSDRNFSNANSYCTNLREGGYSDWRLPTLGETATSSGMGGNGVPSCSGWTWTSTNYYHRDYYYVWNGTSYGNYHGNNTSNYIRCVR